MAARDPKSIHLKLLTDISDEVEPDSAEYQNFVKHMTNYVAKGLLSRNRTFLDKLQCLETQGHLAIGRYETLTKIAIDSGNKSLTGLIKKAEDDIRKAEKWISDTTEIYNRAPSVTTSASSSPPADPPPKRIRQGDSSDPLFKEVDGKGYYETEGKTGYLLILNSKNNREDTDKDVKKIKDFFAEKLRFHTFDPRSQELDDLSTEKLMGCLKSAKEALSGELSKQYYCFVCIILSHGSEDGIATKDGRKSVEEIVKMFSECFAGKPKLFFIQACRGLRNTGHVLVDDEADEIADDDVIEDEADEYVKVPHEADTLIAYATAHGKRAFRRNNIGSWFISEMMREFDQNYGQDHVEDMLITVRQKVAGIYSENQKSMQIPCVQSTLTRRLKFRGK